MSERDNKAGALRGEGVRMGAREESLWPSECRKWRWEVIDSKGRAFFRCPTRRAARYYAADYVGASVRDRLAKKSGGAR